MSSAPTQLAVVTTASNLVSSTAQIQKDYLEEPIARQNSLGNRVRGGLKGKHLTRSHAMRESASPPRTPTPKSDQLTTSPVSTVYSSSTETINDSNKMHVQSSSSSSVSSSIETPSVIVTNQQQQQQIHTSNNNNNNSNNNNINYGVCNQSQLDLDFPKLTPPKSSKCSRNNRDQSQSSSSSSSEKQQLNSSSNSSDYNNKLAFNTNSSAATLIESITGSSNNYNNNNNNNHNHNNNNSNNKSGNKLINDISGNNKSNMPSHNNTNAAQISHQNWNRQNSPPNEKANMNNSRVNNNNNNSSNNSNNNSNNNGSVGVSSSGIQTDTISSPNNNLNTNSPPLNTNYSNDKENRCTRVESQNSNNSGTFSLDDNQSESPTDGSKNERINKKHKSGANSKSSKPRLKNMGSSSSVEGGNSTSGFISRDSSTEQFTDQSGVDLVQFFKETLNKNPKDRCMLMKIEKDLLDLAHENPGNEIKFPAMSSYNRMLIHRVAAFFGMEHNVDASQTCVIVATTKSTRIPDIRFKSLFRDEPRRSILKRDTHSFEDPRQNYLCPDRGILDRKAKSFEEREEEYEKARRRIFKRDGNEVTEEHYWPWSSSDSSDQSARMRQQNNNNNNVSNNNNNNKLLKINSLSSDGRQDGRPSVSKSHSFGGYGGPPINGNNGPLTRGDSINSTKSAGPRLFSKQDSVGSTNTPWRLSPSSSGSIYHFDPSNLPPSQAIPPAMYNSTKSIGINTTMHRKKNDKPRRGGGSDGVREIHNNTGINNGGTVNSGGDGGVGGRGKDNRNNQGIESSIETLSESSAQTVVVNSSDQDDAIVEDSAQEITKESHCHREMSDIQEESINNSNDEDGKTTISKYEHLNDIQQKPKVKNQATSPNIPSPEPEENTQLNEVTTTNTSINDGNSSIEQQTVNNIKIISNSTNSTLQTNGNSDEVKSYNSNSNSNNASNNNNTNNSKTSSNNSNGNNNNTNSNKKDDMKTTVSNSSSALVTYTNSYQNIDGTTMFSPAGNGSYPTTTTYQQGPDGSVYAVQQPMIYAYPSPMEGEFQGYFMPVFDQSGQRDANATLLPTHSQTIYQPTGGATTVVPVAYPTTPYGTAPIYQSQVVYSPEQFAPAVTSTAQMQQFPVTYPVGYSYPYSGYWGQTMTYYVPPQIPGNTVTSSVIPPPIAAASGGNSTSGNITIGGNGKRNSLPQQSLSSGQNSQSATPANTYQFAPNVSLTLASDPNGPAMYAIPQNAVFPNMLPYAPANASSAATGVLTPLPHQPNAVISSLISHPSGPSGSHIPLEQSLACGNYTLGNPNSTHGANGGTPQSTPSTPLSTNISNVALPSQARNPPLFATPPIIPNGFNSQIYSQYPIDPHNTGGNVLSHEKKNSINGGNVGKKNNNYVSNGRQNNFHQHNQQNQNRKPNLNTNDNSNSTSNHNNTNNRQIHNSIQQKRGNEKSHQQISSGIMNNNVNNMVNTQNNNCDNKPRSGVRPKPGNLDLRRNVSQRNTPSTNSIESNNNSPNSIASNNINNSGITLPNDHSQQIYMTRGTHIPPMHPPSAATVVAAAAVANDPTCHQPLIGTAYNHPPAGMYIKYGQTYFTHPTMALPNSRRSPPNELRPPITPLAGVYPAVNMMLPAPPRQMQPRHPNPNYKGNKPR